MRKDGLLEKTYTNEYGKRVHIYARSESELNDKMKLSANGRHFEEVAEEWFKWKVPQLSPNTVSGYQTAVHRAEECFYGRGINTISRVEVMRFLHGLALQHYSQKLINNTKSVTDQIFCYAMLSGEIVENPCSNLPPIKGKPKQRRMPATVSDLEIIERTKDTCIGARMMYTMMYTGLRRGECACLTFGDIDPNRNVIHVTKSIAFSGHSRNPVLKAPKTAQGFREVFIPDNVLKLIYDDSRAKYDLVFFDKLPTKTKLETELRSYQTAHNIKCTAHQLRHNYATILVQNIPLQDAQHLLGHSTISQTVDIYAHCENIVRPDLAKKLESILRFESPLEHQED